MPRRLPLPAGERGAAFWFALCRWREVFEEKCWDGGRKADKLVRAVRENKLSREERARMEEFISLKQLAMELGMDRSNTRKYVLKSGIRPHKRRTPDSGRQLTLALTVEEATQIRAR